MERLILKDVKMEGLNVCVREREKERGREKKDGHW
jgi:hypothetical protein